MNYFFLQPQVQMSFYKALEKIFWHTIRFIFLTFSGSLDCTAVLDVLYLWQISRLIQTKGLGKKNLLGQAKLTKAHYLIRLT